MAIVTPALLLALNTAIQKAFKDAHAAMKVDAFWQKVATRVPSSTSSNTYGWLQDFPQLREWIGDRVVKDMKSQGYEITNRLFEATLGVQRTAIEDDQYGHYSPIAAHMGQEAAQHPDRLISNLMAAGTSSLCYDGQNFFDTDHPVYASPDGTGALTTVSNYDDAAGAANPTWYLLDTRKVLKPFIFQERTAPEMEMKMDPKTSDVVFTRDEYQWGIRYRCEAGFGFWQMAYASKQPLTVENFEAARLAMRKFTADGGRPLGIAPNMIVVNADLQAAAEDIFAVRSLPNGGDNKHYNRLEIVVDDWAA